MQCKGDTRRKIQCSKTPRTGHNHCWQHELDDIPVKRVTEKDLGYCCPDGVYENHYDNKKHKKIWMKKIAEEITLLPPELIFLIGIYYDRPIILKEKQLCQKMGIIYNDDPWEEYGYKISSC